MKEGRPNMFARTLLRLGLAEEPPAAGEVEDPRSLAARLTKLLEDARPVPLTDEVRLDKKEACEIADRIRSGSSEGALLQAAEAVRDAVHNAMPVPLTDQVRLPRDRVAELVRGLRLAS